MRDIYEINKSMHGKFVLFGESLKVKGFDLFFRKMTNAQNIEVKFGVINRDLTEFNYFSLGARVVITIEISKDSFKFSNTGRLILMGYLDFFRHYFTHLQRLDDSHSIIVVLYARVRYNRYINRNRLFASSLKKGICSSEMNSFQNDKNSSVFRDFFHKVFVPKGILKDQCIELIKKELF